jgi:hypothetical protein
MTIEDNDGLVLLSDAVPLVSEVVSLARMILQTKQEVERTRRVVAETQRDALQIDLERRKWEAQERLFHRYMQISEQQRGQTLELLHKHIDLAYSQGEFELANHLFEQIHRILQLPVLPHAPADARRGLL